jgi:hypothetical protein
VKTPRKANSTVKDLFGGIAYNLVADERNLHSVTILTDLLARYHEARAELNSKGLILSRSGDVPRANPVAVIACPC